MERQSQHPSSQCLQTYSSQASAFRKLKMRSVWLLCSDLVSQLSTYHRNTLAVNSRGARKVL